MSLDDDPTDFEGILPVIPADSLPPTIYKDPKSNVATGASAAGVRAFTAQAVAFYFRAPVKAFFRTRVDYLVRNPSPPKKPGRRGRDGALQKGPYSMNTDLFVVGEAQAYAKSINPVLQNGTTTIGQVGFGSSWWRATTPGLLSYAIQHYGWRFIPEQLLPPLAANVAVGAALYTSYLQILGQLHEPSAHATKTVYPPPSPVDTFTAGFAAGTIQSVLAAPLDALQVRFEQRGEKYEKKTMWEYAQGKLREIGIRGIFAGWGLSFLKDSFGSGVFFATFEYVKAQGYYAYVRWYYGALADGEVDVLAKKRGTEGKGITTDGKEDGKEKQHFTPVIKPHYALEPAFLMLAGVTASIAQQFVLYPLSTIQTLHYERLEELDKKAAKLQNSQAPVSNRGRMLRAYYHAYQETWRQAKIQAQSVGVGGLGRWLYRGFWWFTIRQVPSTSAGLIIFELVRRKYGLLGDEVRINQDGYDILLT